MATLKDLLAQRADIEKKIAEASRTERTAAITQVRTLMAEYGLTAADLSARTPAAPKKTKAAGAKVAAKYRDKSTGNAWTGRGLQPKWLRAALAAGRRLEEFKI